MSIKKILVLIFALMAIFCASAPAETLITLNNSTTHITAAGTYRIKGSSDTDYIYIDTPGKDITLILDGVNIKTKFGAPIYIQNANSCTIILEDGSSNTLEGVSGSGIFNFGNPLTITCRGAAANGTEHTCSREVCGELTAIGGDDDAGIGGALHNSQTIPGCNITISGGIITANGGKYGGAGIGGSSYGHGFDITISGGIITANGGTDGGTGIGGGDDGNGSNITIYGGTITANGGKNSAGIGGGEDGYGSDITIYGSNVTATGGENGAGIGGGENGSSSNIRVIPAAGRSISVLAGADSASATAIPGSPFEAEAEITGSIKSLRYVQTNSVLNFPDPIVPDLPETGDEANLVLWLALLAVSTIGVMMFRKRREA